MKILSIKEVVVDLITNYYFYYALFDHITYYSDGNKFNFSKNRKKRIHNFIILCQQVKKYYIFCFQKNYNKPQGVATAKTINSTSHEMIEKY